MGSLGGQSFNARDELQRESARVNDGSVPGLKSATDVDRDSFPEKGFRLEARRLLNKEGIVSPFPSRASPLSFNARDEFHRDPARLTDASVLKGRVDAIGFKLATDVDRDSPLEGAFRLEAR
jgi:hypothetical protein